MKIILDLMGGDNAPLAPLEGAAQAVKEYGVQVVGLGSEALIRKTAADNHISLEGIELVNCTENIEMCDEPARAVRQKKDSTIVVGLNMLKDGKGDAFVSAGSTGALHVGTSLIVRALRGIKRPALATMIPAQKGAYLLLDAGANVSAGWICWRLSPSWAPAICSGWKAARTPPAPWSTTVQKSPRAPRCCGRPTRSSRPPRASALWAT